MTHDPGGKAKPKWPADSVIDVQFSPCGQYRYFLSETWDVSRVFRPAVRVAMWLMMNPSVAGIEHSDPTLRKTGSYSRLWGYGAQFVANVHAYRATDSKRLLEVDDPVGPDNDYWIKRMARRSAVCILAYGQPPKTLRPRAQEVVQMIAETGCRLQYLRLSKDGTPYHPLYLPGDLTPQEFVR